MSGFLTWDDDEDDDGVDHYQCFKVPFTPQTRRNDDRRRVQRCNGCNRVMGGPFLKIFNELFRELRQNHPSHSFVYRMPARNNYAEQQGQPRSRQSQGQEQNGKLVVYGNKGAKVIKYEPEDLHKITDIPDGFECPITMDIMKQPVILSDGHSYEEENIVEWIRMHGAVSPLTQQTLYPLIGFYNLGLKNRIAEWVESVGGRVYTERDISQL